MIDSHVHIERGTYTADWIRQFTETAQKNSISEIYLLEHSFRFYEFEKLYDGVKNYNQYQRGWLESRMKLSINDYIRLISEMRKESFPVKIKWGLEVCHIPGKEHIIRNVINSGPFDFITGSVHWIEDWGFDHKAEFWNGKNTELLYQKYYEIMIHLARSGLYNHLAHPDSIKCFNSFSSADLIMQYEELSRCAEKNGIKIEVSAGLANNYGHNSIGINERLLGILKKNGNKLIPASDAHKPEDVGKNITLCCKQIESPLKDN